MLLLLLTGRRNVNVQEINLYLGCFLFVLPNYENYMEYFTFDFSSPPQKKKNQNQIDSTN